MRLTPVGTSGFGVSATRHAPAFLVNDDILLDVGEGTTGRLVAWGLPVARISHLLVSHGHWDHVSGFGGLVWQQGLVEEKTDALTVHGPRAVLDALAAILQEPAVPAKLRAFPIHFRPVALESTPDHGLSDEIVLPGGITARAAPVTHSIPTVGYRLENQATGKVLVYTADCSAVDLDSVPPFYANADLLLHEASFPDEMADLARRLGHSTPSQAARVARRAKAKRLVLVHHPPLPPDEPLEQFTRQARAIFPNVEIAEEGRELVL